MTLSIAAAWYASNLYEQETLNKFKAGIDNQASILKEEINLNLEDLYALKAFFDAIGTPSRQQFHIITTEQLLRHPDIKALEWIPRVPDSSRDNIQARAIQDGFTGFRITERSLQNRLVHAATRSEYFPVYYVEPLTGNEAALGFDLASNEIRRKSLEQARDSGKPHATARIKLVQEKSSRHGFLIFLPIYNGHPNNVSERQQQLKGFVLGVYIIQEIYEKAPHSHTAVNDDIAIKLIDNSASDENSLLYEHIPDGEVVKAIEYEKPLGDLFGRKWSLVASPTTSYMEARENNLPFLIFLGGLIFTLLLLRYIWSILRQMAGSAEALAQSSASLIAEKARLKAIINNVVDGIITISSRGTIEEFNPAAETIFGYSSREVQGKNIKTLMPEPYRSQHDQFLTNYLTSGEKKVIGIGREVTGLRKDGSTFTMDLAVSELQFGKAQHFVGIIRDITDRKRIDQMKTEFISTVSHELRTPLTSIKGSLGLILGGVAGVLPEKASSLLNIADNNAERLIMLINDILDIEKIEAGKIQYDFNAVKMTRLIKHSIEENRSYGKKFDVDFALNVQSDNEFMVNADENRLLQVLANLLSNATKYSPAGGLVEINVERINNKIRVAVHDNGKGIPDEFKPRIFSKFSQADSSDTRQKGGTGLGLSITRAIVEQHEGSIWFDSYPDRGTTFYFDLPELHTQSCRTGGSDTPDSDGVENDA